MKTVNSYRTSILLYCKGLAMGMADSVPGVSGATIAVITNIYEELIDSIKSANPLTLGVLWKEGPKAFWLTINGTFLLTLFLGILTSLLFAANTVPGLLANYFPFVMAFFIGLVLASCQHMQKEVTNWRLTEIAIALTGFAFVILMTLVAPVDPEVSTGYLFFCGMVAICAFILPGLSGALILLLLGVYDYILSALASFELIPISVFVAGAAVGIISFSQVLSLAFKKFHEKMYAFITGMLLGSIYLLWPWKQVLSYRINSHAEQVPLQRMNVTPAQYETLVGNDAHIAIVVALGVAGFILIHFCQKLSNSNSGAAP